MKIIKVCSRCRISKPFTDYYRDKRTKDGLLSACKECTKVQQKVFRRENEEKESKRKKKWKKKNKEYTDKRDKRYYLENKEHISNRKKEYYSIPENKAKRVATTKKYKLSKIDRTPPWVNADKILGFYVESAKLTELTGVQHHVDHIIPLQGTHVSGLHVENNLQVIPWEENIEKENKYESQTKKE